MENLKQQFQEETKLSFNDIPINGVHLEYINWLEKRIEALTIPVVSVECEHPFAYVHTRCMGEINNCLKCGKDL